MSGIIPLYYSLKEYYPMKKRLICFLLAAIMLAGALFVAPIHAQAASAMESSDEMIEIVKKLE